MLRLLELLTNFYWLLLPQTIVQSFRQANWDKAAKRAGLAGIASEGFRSLIGTNSWPFFVPINSAWCGRDIEKLLANYNIPMWGWGVSNQTMFFQVREEDAALASSLMLQAGIPLIG